MLPPAFSCELLTTPLPHRCDVTKGLQLFLAFRTFRRLGLSHLMNALHNA